MTCGKSSIKLLLGITVEIRILEILNMNFWAISILGLIRPNTDKYFIKKGFDAKLEINIFEISNVPNFNEFWAFLILGLIQV